VANTASHHETGATFALHPLQQSTPSAQSFGPSTGVPQPSPAHVTPVVCTATVLSAGIQLLFN